MREVKVKLEPSQLSSPCWIWQSGIHHTTGYGIISRYYGGNAYKTAHRIVYESLMKPLTSEQHLHHLCHRKLCVNPTHVEVLSVSEHQSLHGRFRDGKCTLHPRSKVRSYSNRKRCNECCTISARKDRELKALRIITSNQKEKRKTCL